MSDWSRGIRTFPPWEIFLRTASTAVLSACSAQSMARNRGTCGRVARTPPLMYLRMSLGVGFTSAFMPVMSCTRICGTMVMFPWYFCLNTLAMSCPKSLGSNPMCDSAVARYRTSISTTRKRRQYRLLSFG
eukprot:scaffold193_cov255-Pinguiococcus_pyrenoidosus.AAC.26